MDEYKRLLAEIPKIAKAVNEFSSDAVQQEVFRALVDAMGIGGHTTENADEQSEKQAPPARQRRAAKKASSAKRAQDESDPKQTIDLVAIVNAINESEQHDEITKFVLNESAQLPRLLMCYYFARNVGDGHLSTGDVERITDQLGVKIRHGNAARVISQRGGQKHLAADKVRKVGVHVRYKINRKGIQAFERLLNGEKI